MIIKECKKCGQTKKIEFFLDGESKICDSCYSDKQEIARWKNREKAKAALKESRCLEREKKRQKKIEESRARTCKHLNNKMGEPVRNPKEKEHRDYSKIPLVKRHKKKLPQPDKLPKHCNKIDPITNEKIEMPKVSSPLHKFIKE